MMCQVFYREVFSPRRMRLKPDALESQSLFSKCVTLEQQVLDTAKKRILPNAEGAPPLKRARHI